MTREEAIDILLNTGFFGRSMDDIDGAIDMAVEALKAEPKHAHVIIDEDGNMECSNCGSSNCFDNYCGHCGAKLTGERKD